MNPKPTAHIFLFYNLSGILFHIFSDEFAVVVDTTESVDLSRMVS
jgi:hypothetical protein